MGYEARLPGTGRFARSSHADPCDHREMADWPDLLRSIEPTEVLGAVRALRSRTEERPAGDVLGEVSALLTKIALRDPTLALSQTSDFAKTAARALDEMPKDVADVKPRALLGTIAYNATLMMIGSRIPETAVSTAERNGLGLLSQAAIDEKIRTTACSAALGANVPKLVPLLLGRETHDPRPSDAPKRIDDAALYFGAALEAGWKQPAIEVAFQTWLAAFPTRIGDGTLTWFDLASIARMYFNRFGHQQPQKTFASLAAMLKPHDAPPAKVHAMRSLPTPIAGSMPRPRRGRPTPQDGEWTRISLHDLEGLHGGFSVHVFADGEFWFDEVSAGARHSRLFRTTLPADQMTALGALLEQHDVRQIQIPAREGIPGESRPTIDVTTPTWRHEVSKWRGDVHASFDAIATFLWSTGKRLAASSAPTWEGPFDWHWKPG